MKRYFYIFRHGETNHLRDGHRNYPAKSSHIVDQGMSPEGYLTDSGLQQAKELGNFLLDKKLQIVYSSPYERAIDTAKIAVEAYRNTPIVIENNLREGLFYHKELDDEAFDKNKDRIEAAYIRVSKIIGEIIVSEYENIAIASHGGITRCILAIAGFKIDEIKPCECFCLSYDDDKWELLDRFSPNC